MTPDGAQSSVLVPGLRPAIKLYFWVVYQDAQGKMSRPSPVATTTLAEAFKEQ
jgi:hypothetical protein